MFRKLFRRTGDGTQGRVSLFGRRQHASLCNLHDAAFVALVFSCGLACAAEPAVATKHRIDQPAQPLADSLRAIARQTGVSVLFDPGKVSGRMSKAVSGQMTASEAITRALEGSDLVLTVMADGSVVVRAAVRPASPPASRTLPVASSQPAAAEGMAPTLLLAQAGAVSGPALSTVAANGVTNSLEKVEVTGSRLKRISADGPAPVNVYSRDDIERSGQPSLERFLSSLNEASVSQGEGSSGQTTGQGSVQLRGLPLGSTLVLINGRRVQAVGSSTGNFFNLNLIPMAAVERVEIVPVGSSAVYGGDALAGVVNIILKKSLDGMVLDASLASGKGTGAGSLSFGAGGGDAAGSFLLLGSVRKTTPLTMAERGFFRDADYRRFGGLDARTRSCTPGTVTSTTTANLPGLSAAFAGIPVATPGQPLTISSFAATAGKANLCNSLANGNGSALVHGTENVALHATADRRLTEVWSVFSELTFARDQLRAEQAGFLLSNVLVPATNPHNPFGAPVRVTTRLGLENGAETFTRDTDFTRVLVGARAEVSAAWEAEASLSTTRDNGESFSNASANTVARAAALGASTAAAAINPFTTGIAAPDAVLRSIWPGSLRENHGRKDQVNGFLRGSLLDLPTGSVDLIAGAEAARDRYQTKTPGVFDIAASRSNRAVYGELRVPLWRSADDTAAQAGAGPAWDRAALTVAARRDQYSDFGSASTYQAGLEFRPTRTTLLRASTATSFKPPTLLQTTVDDVGYTSEDFALVDPKRANAPVVGAEVLRTTNQNLNAEKGRAVSVGAVWEPASAGGTRFGVTAWRVKINGLISLLWPQTALNNEALFPGFVTRGPSVGGVPGAITQVLYSEVNYGRVDTAGADMEVAHVWKQAGGKWMISASATRTTQYDVVIVPGAPVADRLGRRAVDYWAPKWKGRVFAGLDRGAWSLGVSSRYLGAYRDLGTSERRLGSYWLHDLSGSVDLKRLGLGLLAFKDARLSLAIANVGDRLPEFVESSPYYDVTQGDWRGRYTNLRLSLSW